jgi:hypothetical protein
VAACCKSGNELLVSVNILLDDRLLEVIRTLWI